MKRVVLLVAALALTLAGCTSGEPEVEPAATPDGWQRHEFPGGTVAAPADWTLDPVDEGDDLTLQGPAPDGGLPPIARFRVDERDGVPFDGLLQTAAAQLTLQFGDVQPGDVTDLDLDGAESAEAGTFRYQADVDGTPVDIEERIAVAWFGEDRQLQVRIGSPADQAAELDDTLQQILDSITFGA